MNETLERLRDQNRSLLALRKDPSLATAKGNDETGMGQLSQEDLAPLRATATAIAVLIRHGAVTQDRSEIYCESCDFSGKTLDMSRPDYANTANFAQWHGADLSETDFHNAILKNANFTGLFLRGASFDSADLIRAKFAGADLQGAKLTITSTIPSSLLNHKLADVTLVTGAQRIGVYSGSPNGQPRRPTFTDRCRNRKAATAKT